LLAKFAGKRTGLMARATYQHSHTAEWLVWR
jgi:hypothetical protein